MCPVVSVPYVSGRSVPAPFSTCDFLPVFCLFHRARRDSAESLHVRLPTFSSRRGAARLCCVLGLIAAFSPEPYSRFGTTCILYFFSLDTLALLPLVTQMLAPSKATW